MDLCSDMLLPGSDDRRASGGVLRMLRLGINHVCSGSTANLGVPQKNERDTSVENMNEICKVHYVCRGSVTRQGEVRRVDSNDERRRKEEKDRDNYRSSKDDDWSGAHAYVM